MSSRSVVYLGRPLTDDVINCSVSKIVIWKIHHIELYVMHVKKFFSKTKSCEQNALFEAKNLLTIVKKKTKQSRNITELAKET